MIPVYTPERVRALDEAVIRGLGLPGRQLMELAGRGAAEILHHRWPHGEVAVLCGPGNNGGDGYVLARWLHGWGRGVRIWASAPPATEDAAANHALCERLGIRFAPLEFALAGAAVAVDALLGTGQRRAPAGPIAQAVRALAQAPAVCALDLPTGLDGATGQPLGEVVRADLTVTFGVWKTGLLCEPGASLAGEVRCVPIGLDLGPLHAPALAEPDAQILEEPDVLSWLPPPAPGAAKWDRGHVAVLAGGGAAVLAAHGAFRAGAGLVSLLAPRRDWDRLHGLWPAVILGEPGSLEPGRHDVVVMGPGLGLDRAGEVLRLWADWPGGLVADADALSALAKGAPGTAAGPRVITPHVAEAGRLLGIGRAAVEADRYGALRALAGVGGGCTPLLKGRNTLILGDRPWVSPTGSERLATAGSGDVLAGMVGGLLARGLPVARAAAAAAWLHGRAGERMRPGDTAGELLECLRG